jgi:thiol-disulfide isomerase/thioredoxin
MQKVLISLLLCLILAGCGQKQEKQEQVISTETSYLSAFEKFMQQDDKLYVVNFWATWCVPCVKELPDFMKVHDEFKNEKNFKMILISMDKMADFESKVKTFVKENNITPDVYLLSDNKKMNEWIPKIHPNWSGAIPATAMYKNGKRVFFHEGTLTYEELKTIVNNHL